MRMIDHKKIGRRGRISHILGVFDNFDTLDLILTPFVMVFTLGVWWIEISKRMTQWVCRMLLLHYWKTLFVGFTVVGALIIASQSESCVTAISWVLMACNMLALGVFLTAIEEVQNDAK